MTQLCPTDNKPHDFVPIPGNDGWVYCTKCTLTQELQYAEDPDPEPEPPEPPDPNPDSIFTGSGQDDTTAFQNWINSLPNGTTCCIEGTVRINHNGIQILDKTNLILTSQGGQFLAISDELYNPSVFAAMVYLGRCTGCTVSSIEFNCNNKRAMGIYVHECEDTNVTGCSVHDIKNDPNGAPWAGIYGERSANTVISDCEVRNTEHNVRGIWLGVGDRYEIEPEICNCVVENTGHTGIVTESQGPYVHDNDVSSVLDEGTGYKFIPRGQPLEALWEDNHVFNTGNAGMMVEGSDVDPQRIVISGFSASNCGREGTRFGAFYFSSGQGSKNVEVYDCTVDSCKSFGAALYLTDSHFQNNRITNTQYGLALEQDCHNIQLDDSGYVEIGPRCSDIWVNGEKIA